MSRTTLPELSNYHARELEALEDLGCPISKEALKEMAAAEKLLGPEIPNEETVSKTELFEISISMGSHRENFEPVRDIITRLRREWTEQYWDAYVRKRWEFDLRGVGDTYHRETAKRGKPPTFKAFGKHVERPANTWFAGGVPGVYAAIGATAPPAQTSDLLMPADRKGFAAQIFARLGGAPRQAEDASASYKEVVAQRDKIETWSQYVSLANEGLQYVQHWEALGEPPELKQLGSGARRFKSRSKVLDDDPNRAFEIFGQAVADVLAGEPDASAAGTRA